MRYLVALDPQLGLSAAEFAEAWNASEHVNTGTASVEAPTTESFLPLEVTVALISAAAAVPSTIIATFISDYLRKKFIDSDPGVTVTTIETPDGQPVLIIKREEQS